MIVLDSSFIVGFHNERDAHHNTARAQMERFLNGEWGRGLLLEYVFLEVATCYSYAAASTSQRVWGRLLLDADELDFVPCSDFFSDAFEMFTHQWSTRLSFADAAIAHVAQERADGPVLTFDEEFSKLPGIQVPGRT